MRFVDIETWKVSEVEVSDLLPVRSGRKCDYIKMRLDGNLMKVTLTRFICS